MVIHMVMKKNVALITNGVVPAGEFKAKCLALTDEVGRDGKSVTITKHGKPVAVLSPVLVVPKSGFGFARGGVQIIGDIVSPIDVIWDAAR